MKIKSVFTNMMKCIYLVICLTFLRLYAQPGPGSFSMFVYNNARKELKLHKEYEMYDICYYHGFKMTSGEMGYGGVACNGKKTIPYVSVIIEAAENIITLIYKKDTMHVVVKNISSIGYKHFIDTLIFNKGWYEFKYPKFDKPPYESCFFNLVRLGKETLVAIKPQ